MLTALIGISSFLLPASANASLEKPTSQTTTLAAKPTPSPATSKKAKKSDKKTKKSHKKATSHSSKPTSNTMQKK